MLGRKWTPASGEDHDNHDTQAFYNTPVIMVFERDFVWPPNGDACAAVVVVVW